MVSAPTGMHNFMCKLKPLKLVLNAWNKNVFGNIHKQVIEQEQLVLSSEIAYDYKILRMPYFILLDQQETFWTQKSRFKWLMDADLKHLFFMLTVQDKQRRLQICKIQNSQNQWCTDIPSIQQAAIDYIFTFQEAAEMDLVSYTIWSIHSFTLSSAHALLPNVEEFMHSWLQNSIPGEFGCVSRAGYEAYGVCMEAEIRAMNADTTGPGPPVIPSGTGQVGATGPPVIPSGAGQVGATPTHGPPTKTLVIIIVVFLVVLLCACPCLACSLYLGNKFQRLGFI